MVGSDAEEVVIYRFCCNARRFQRALLEGKGCSHEGPAFFIWKQASWPKLLPRLVPGH